MRVLFTANPEKAHLLAMVSMAWALRTAGHEVRFASQPAFTSTITQAGLTAVAVGRDVDLWDLIPRDPRFPNWVWEPEYGLPTPYDVVDDPSRATWEHMVEGYQEQLTSWHKPASFPMISGLVEFAQAWKPDLILWEPLSLAGPIAARACGAAHARLLWGVDVFGLTRQHYLRLRGDRTEDPLGGWLAGYARRFGGDFAEDMLTGHFTIDQLPSSLRVEADLHYESVQFTPYGGPAVVPKWLWEKPSKPRVALTMGLSLTDHKAGYKISVQDVFDALADLDIELVATIAESAQPAVTHVPDNVRMVPYVPLHALVPTCTALINHGGFGTVMTTARHGVPQLVVPWDFDAPALAARVGQQGSALVTRADEASGQSIRDSVLRLLGEAPFRDRAGELQREIQALPTPNELVGRLEELTTTYRA
ncbi:activator-dependent family glycosyltransferase [Actinoplanes sp. NEAU-A12]|uniref:Activator-dependent family glycosyltransferase n=1 Tax=Actinoplanes sandaracinus TaxID=3045177 RepID=A0ABT6WZI4_9ACTN|nr:activator-dependent family glycosyltransferase [Actinoplanes sandaracinus]MDI6105166.1 activator-dependent family glycosyltransferase [Actinoplanes sandaracinus]